VNSDLSPQHRRGRIGAFLALALVVLGGRLWVVAGAATDLPYWDQWFISFFQVVVPWMDGELRPWEMPLHTENEHHLLYQRFLTWGLLQVTGRWEPGVEVVVASIFRAFELCVVFTLLAAGQPGYARRGLLVILAALGALPAASFNLLSNCGIQYFIGEALHMGLLAVCARALDGRRFLLAVALSLAAFMNMANVVITLAAAVLTLMMRRLVAGRAASWTVAPAAGLLGLALVFFAATPRMPGLGARGPAEFMDTFVRVLAWPFPDAWGLGLFILLPPILLFARLRDLPEESPSWFLLSLSIGSILQAAAIAFGRARSLPRSFAQYTDGLWMTLIIAGLVLVTALRPRQGERRRRPSGLEGLVGAFVLLLIAIGAVVRGIPETADAARAARLREPLLATALETGDFRVFSAETLAIVKEQSAGVFDFFDHPSGRFAIPRSIQVILVPGFTRYRAALPASLARVPPSRVVRASRGLALAGPGVLLVGLLLMFAVVRRSGSGA